MSPVARVRLFFFVQFMSLGMVNAFGGPWLESLGLSEEQIGIIYAVPLAAMLLLTVPVGQWADRARDWRDVIRVGMVFAGVAPFGFYLVDGFIGVLVIWALMVAGQALMVPVMDGAAIRFGLRHGQSLGGFRALTTTGYLLVVLAAGPVLGHWGLSLFLPLLIGLSLLRTGAALALPRLRAAGSVTQRAPLPWPLLRQRWFLWPFLGGAILLATTFVLNGFQALFWAQQGRPAGQIGLLIAIGAAAEAVLFALYPRLARWASPARLLALAALAAVLRYGLLAFDLPLALLIPVQMLHALTFGLAFIASASFIAEHTGEEIAASAQAAHVMCYQALSIALLPGFGWLAGGLGAAAYFALSAVAAVAFALITLAGHAPTVQKLQMDG